MRNRPYQVLKCSSVIYLRESIKTGRSDASKAERVETIASLPEWSFRPKMASVQDRPKGGARKVVVATLVQTELVEWREINPKQCAALRLGPSRTDPRTDSRAATPLC